MCELVRQEAEGDYANFHVNGRKEYEREGGERAGESDLRPPATERGILTVEPLVERDYWVLQLTAERDLRSSGEASEAFDPSPRMSVDDFVADFLATPDTRSRVSVAVENDRASRAFDTWLHQIKQRHGQQ